MITAKVEKITPKVAEEMLEHNTDNFRKIRRSVVNGYADDILNGRWQLNGETIVFDEDGVLKDGQHRLCGVVETGKTIECLVVRGVSREVDTYNRGLQRTIHQQVKARGVDCNSTVTAAASIIVNRFMRVRQNNAVTEYIDTHIDELNRAFRVCTFGNNKKSKTAVCVAATYLLLRTKSIPVYELELFWRLFNDFGTTSADGYEIGPAVIARKMFDDREGKSGYQIQKERMEILIMATSDFHKNKKRELKYKIGEPFQFMELLDKVCREDKVEVK